MDVAVAWDRGRLARFWYAQPRFDFDEDTRVCRYQHGPNYPLELLDAILSVENTFAAPTQSPAFVLFPELSIPADQIEALRARVTQARPNTIFVVGLTPITEIQAAAIEDPLPPYLWAAPSNGRLANCAIVGVGGSSHLYLQPKIVPSRWENNWLWAGDAIRYFRGQYFRFCVLICSELLDRPDNRTTARDLVDHVVRDFGSGALELVVWVQYNQASRSDAFLESIAELQRLGPTVAIVNTTRPGNRFNNFAVGGALAPHAALASQHSLLVKDFHYVEPIHPGLQMGRAVLLRYDADVYQVDTALASAVVAPGGVAKGAFFQTSQPYVFREKCLTPSNDKTHLFEISELAVTMAIQALQAAQMDIRAAQRELVALSTQAFLECLDVASLPQPIAGVVHHSAGQRHTLNRQDADFACTCWAHRTCIDRIADDRQLAEPLAQYLQALGAMKHAGVAIEAAYDEHSRTNARLRTDGTRQNLGIVYSGDLNTRGVATALGYGPAAKPRLVPTPYIVLGPEEHPMHTRLADIDVSQPAPIGGPKAGVATPPIPWAIYERAFWAAYAASTLAQLIETLLAGADPR